LAISRSLGNLTPSGVVGFQVVVSPGSIGSVEVCIMTVRSEEVNQLGNKTLLPIVFFFL
jgi:hypothetical protein